jgi:hypothetical protein
MNIVYRVYANDGQGGLIDYSTPIATTPGLTCTTPALALASNNVFAVRAFDSDVGIEEANTMARVRIIIDSNGQDVSSQPNAPHALSVRPLASGTCRATWGYIPNGQGGGPLGFYVYLCPGTFPNYATPVADTAFRAGNPWYACTLSGLSDGVTYTVAVRAYNSVAIEQNTTAIAPVVGKWTAPTNVDTLTGLPTYHA